MHRVSATRSERLTARAALALIALSGCSDHQPYLTSPRNETPSFLVAAGGGTWMTKASALHPVVAPGGAVLNQQFYVASEGLPPESYSQTDLQVYDPATNAWTNKTPASIGRVYARAAGIGGKFYVVGGCVNFSPSTGGDCRIGTTNLLQAYDPLTDAWTTKSSMPTPRFLAAAGVIGGKLYVAGGYGPCPPCNRLTALEVYDPTTDGWTSLAPMPGGRGDVEGAVVNSKLYVIGTEENTFTATLDVYDTATDSWSSGTPMSTPRGNPGVGEVNGIIYAVSGSLSPGFANTVEAYDPASDSWVAVAPIPSVVYIPATVSIGGALYIVGQNSNGASTMLQAFTPAYPFSGFFSPVNDPDTVNVAKAGSAIPVKFSLGSDLGLNILSAGSPSSAAYACGAGPTDAIDQTVAATTSGLQYDPTANQYIYTWKTDKGWVGTCRKFSLGLADGSTHVALFQFK